MKETTLKILVGTMTITVLGILIRFQFIDEFTIVFPIYYRAVGLLIFGFWCWGFNLQILKRFSIDLPNLMQSEEEKSEIEPKKNSDETSTLHSKIYEMASFLTIIYCLDLLCFILAKDLFPSVYLPTFLYISLLLLILCPFKIFHYEQRITFFKSVWHVLRGIFRLEQINLQDVILTDIFTSYAKVFGDFEMTICLILSSNDMHYNSSSYSGCIHSAVAPIVTSLPFFFRLVQCFYQYRNGENELGSIFKYASAIAVIFFSALRKNLSSNLAYFQVITYFWILFVFVNSVYSFYWDIFIDWRLGLGKNIKHPFLRERLVFESPPIYYGAIFMDFLLRFTWSLKLSSHIYFRLEKSVFFFEVLEIIRRTIWIFFKAENEFLKIKRKMNV